MTHSVLAAVLTTAVLTTVALAIDMPAYKVTMKHENDRTEVKTLQNKVIFDIYSPRGISHAMIERTGEKWPETVVLQLHLSGLESFQISNGKIGIGTSVPSADETPATDKASSPETKDPLSLEVRRIGKDGQPDKTIPLKNGYMQIQLPRAFLEENPKSISLNWIDFYRV